jgi:hypothetical protein
MSPFAGVGDHPHGVDPKDYLGMDTETAVATARVASIEQIRVLHCVGGKIVGSMDMMLDVNRLTLETEEGKVIRATWG